MKPTEPKRRPGRPEGRVKNGIRVTMDLSRDVVELADAHRSAEHKTRTAALEDLVRRGAKRK